MEALQSIYYPILEYLETTSRAELFGVWRLYIVGLFVVLPSTDVILTKDVRPESS